MTTATTYPSDGRLTSLSTYVGPMTGQELFMIVFPPTAAGGINYQVPATTLASYFVAGSNNTNAGPNLLFAGPPSGATATATFRGMVVADLPAGTSGLPLVGNGAGTTNFQVLGLVGGGLGTNALATNSVVLGEGSGAVDGVAATTAGYALVSNGSTAPPSYQLLPVASLTGAFAVAQGGSGTTSLATGVLLGQGSGPFDVVAATTAGFVLTSNGSTSKPIWTTTVPGTTGVTQVAHGGTGTASLGTSGVLLGEGTNSVGVAFATTAGYPLIANGSATDPSFQALALNGAGVSGLLAVPHGGLGTATLVTAAVVLGQGTAAVSLAAATTAGYPFVANGSTSNPSFQALNLTSTFVTSFLTVPNGGIGTTALATNGIVLAKGAGAFATLNATTAGLVLVSQGSASPPIYTTSPGSGITSLTAGTGLLGGTITTSGTLYANTLIPVPLTTNYIVATTDGYKEFSINAKLDLTIQSAASYTTNFNFRIRNNTTRGVKVQFNLYTSALLYPGESALLWTDTTSWFSDPAIVTFPGIVQSTFAYWNTRMYNSAISSTSGATVYVDALNGADNNDGLAAGSTGAFQTLTQTWEFLMAKYDGQNKQPWIQMSTSSAYTTANDPGGQVLFYGLPPGSHFVNLTGATTLAGAGNFRIANGISGGGGIQVNDNCVMIVQGIEFLAGTTAFTGCIGVNAARNVIIDFANCLWGNFTAGWGLQFGQGAQITMTGDQEFALNACDGFAIGAPGGWLEFGGNNYTCQNMAFGVAFVDADRCEVEFDSGANFTGSSGAGTASTGTSLIANFGFVKTNGVANIPGSGSQTTHGGFVV